MTTVLRRARVLCFTPRMKNTALSLCLALLCCLTHSGAADFSGEAKVWHKLTIDFAGPRCSETGTPNPFTHYRLDVTFRHGDGTTYKVPGYFAADGNAANTSAAEGDVWRVHFNPDRAGEWSYAVAFTAGGKAWVPLHGRTGAFTVAATDKTGRDFRARGRLRHTGDHFLRFAGTGEVFLKAGADAPENLLAYADFDGGFKSDGVKDELIKTWRPHVRDWREGDPTWQGGKGKGLVGALNYLAGKGMNAFSFLPLNIGGDDRNVFPYVDDKTFDRFDVSRLDQWEIVFEHGQRQGLFLHFKTQEAENQGLLDGGRMGPQRALYYRELVARFGHHNALNWNLGEENGAWGGHRKNAQNTEDRRAMVRWFREHDPYRHHVVIHNGQPFDDLLGPAVGMTGISLQTNKEDFRNVYPQVRRWREASAQAGFPWAVACDEPGDAQHSLLPDADDPRHDDARRNALWGTFMAGGWGVEWYFGYKHAHSDLTCQDWRSRDAMWDQSRHALDFFRDNQVPVWHMAPLDGFAGPNAWTLAGREEDGRLVAVVYSRDGDGDRWLKLPAGDWLASTFDPRSGEAIASGELRGGNAQMKPPGEDDWVLLLRQKAANGAAFQEGGRATPAPAPRKGAALPPGPVGTGKTHRETDGIIAGEAEDFVRQTLDGTRRWYRSDQRLDLRDGDPPHAEGAGGGVYLEILPDTRRTHADRLIAGENFSNEPGRMGVLTYRIDVKTPGRWYVWVRAHSTGGEDNGIHVGLDGQWPASGQRMQWCQGKGQWWWESKQRTAKVHCGEPGKIYLDIDKAGEHILQFSMREDGFEFDAWRLTRERGAARP